MCDKKIRFQFTESIYQAINIVEISLGLYAGLRKCTDVVYNLIAYSELNIAQCKCVHITVCTDMFAIRFLSKLLLLQLFGIRRRTLPLDTLENNTTNLEWLWLEKYRSQFARTMLFFSSVVIAYFAEKYVNWEIIQVIGIITSR